MSTEKDPYAVEVGRRIVAARRDHGMSQKDLAELVDVAERSMQAYESGEVVPYRKAKQLSLVLNRSIGWILHGDNEEKNMGDIEPILTEIRDILKEMAGRPQYVHDGNGAPHEGAEKA